MSLYISKNTGLFREISCEITADMAKKFLSAAHTSRKIYCQVYWMTGVFVIPVNSRHYNAISTDTRICYFVRFSFV